MFAGIGHLKPGGSLLAQRLACTAHAAAQELDPRGVELFGRVQAASMIVLRRDEIGQHGGHFIDELADGRRRVVASGFNGFEYVIGPRSWEMASDSASDPTPWRGWSGPDPTSAGRGRQG